MTKTKTFPLNQKLAWTKHGIYVATCVSVKDMAKLQTNIPQNGYYD